MSAVTGKRRTNNNEIEYDIVWREEDGMFNFWQKRYVKGYSYGPENLVWVLKGVYNKIPNWIHNKAADQRKASK